MILVSTQSEASPEAGKSGEETALDTLEVAFEIVSRI